MRKQAFWSKHVKQLVYLMPVTLTVTFQCYIGLSMEVSCGPQHHDNCDSQYYHTIMMLVLVAGSERTAAQVLLT